MDIQKHYRKIRQSAISDKERLSARMAEYHMLEGRAKFSREDLAKLEILVPGAIAALYSWLFSRPDIPPVGVVALLWIPVIVSCLSAMRSQLRHKGILRIERHMASIERLWADGTGVLGYHDWIKTQRSPKKGEIRFAYSRILFWIIMISGTFSLALYGSIWGLGRPSKPRKIAEDATKWSVTAKPIK